MTTRGGIPPHNLEAEQSLLCSFLFAVDPEEAVKTLDADDFYKTTHKNIWNAVYSLYKNKEPIGPNEVYNELKGMGKLESDTGTYLSKLMDIPQAIGIEHTAKIIKACSVRRKILVIASQMEKRALDDTVDASNLIETAKADIESVVSGGGHGRIKIRSLASEIREWVHLQEGTFCLRNIYDSLQLSTRDEKKNVSIILKRLSEGDNKLITKMIGIAGSYKTITNTAKRIDLADRSDLKGELPIKFPFGIENYIKPMPGCVYVIAGETDSGKSAFLMNFAKKNTPLNMVNYFSSEMGKQELFDRTDHFWPGIGADANFKFYEDCYEDFDQLIKPDEINIIDYLELFDNFYLMASIIDKIGRALQGGVVFIALQKPKNRDEGTGGERTKNLARLYLSLSPGVLKIVKAKNWRDPKLNPNGLSISFKLAAGCKFSNTAPWEKP